MWNRRTSPLAAALAGASALLLVQMPALGAENEPDGRVAELDGTWRGEGTLLSDDGDRDPISCSASYRSSDGGRKLTQELSCDTKKFKIELRSRLSNNDGDLGGGWFEKLREVSGRADGRLDTHALTLRLKAAGFKATLTAALGKCEQQVELTPDSGDVERVDVTLKRDSC